MSSRLKRKLSETTTYEDLLVGWTQCCFLIKGKGRLCNIARSEGSLFCGNHQQDNAVTPKRLPNKTGALERVPCTLDPNHSVYKCNLEAHLKVCTFKKQKEGVMSQAFYCEDCNGGSYTSFISKFDGLICPTSLRNKILSTYSQIFESGNHFEHPSCSPELEECKIIRSKLGEGQTSFDRLRHVEQDIEIVRHIKNVCLVRSDAKNIIVEYGAGKGLLGWAISYVDPTATLLFVERSGNRKKIDRVLREEKKDFHRVRMDIRHCFVPNLPAIVSDSNSDKEVPKNVVVVAKHLCGEASDLAIRSLMPLRKSDVGNMTCGLCIATCCHHACQFADYTGAEWLVQQGFTAAEFDVLRQWSSWAHSVRRPKVPEALILSAEGTEHSEEKPQEAEEHVVPESSAATLRPEGITAAEMGDIGTKVKRILDYGRVQFIRNTLQLEARYVQYCDRELSPECMMILAFQPQQPQCL